MNFFERQQVARRNTRVMLWLFAAAVVCIVLAVDLVVMIAWLWMTSSVMSGSVMVWISILTGAALLAVSAWEIAQLRSGGGDAVARMVGGRRVLPGSTERLERRLLNVVEEMAIASGTRVPAVYVMDGEGAINAFAAGHDVSRSVVAVTRGTLETLTRDELQGVVAHEFSHIVNGDMSLNIRMIGVLAGIVFIGAVGGFVMRSGRRLEGRGAIPVVAFGLGLFVVGYVGLFFARLIKASVSRQREFLADAASVQFTRNPDGLAGALDQIRSSGRDSLIQHRHAEDVSHLFFGRGVAMGFEALFATHPPLDERIRRVHPRFQPATYRGKRVASPETVENGEAVGAMAFTGDSTHASRSDARAGDGREAWGRTPRESADLVGSVEPGKVSLAHRIVAAIGPSLGEQLRMPETAAAAVVALALARDEVVMDEQLLAVRTAGAPRLAEAAVPIARELRGINPGFHLPLVDLALPALKLATPELKLDLLRALQAVIYADRRISLFGFVLFNLLRTQLEPPRHPTASRYKALVEVEAEVRFLLTLVAQAGARRGPDATSHVEAAYARGMQEMGFTASLPLRRETLGLVEANAALDKLRELAPMPKAVLVKGLFAAVTSDGSIRVIEAALMRMVGAVLDCPLPPLLENLEPEALVA